MQDTLKVAKALSDASRLRIVVSLAGVGELCVCQITEMLGLSPATVSRHLSVLQNANIVWGRKDGRWVYYRLSEGFPPLPKQWVIESLSPSREAVDDRKRLDDMRARGVEAGCKPGSNRGRNGAEGEARLLRRVEVGRTR